jgi:hypothetical protein
MEITKDKVETKGNGEFPSVRTPKVESKPSDIKVGQVEVPSIRLSPEQIEEIHSDEYALMLFYATRVEPLSVAEIKKQLPEPEPKKAQSVLDRFVKVGLVHLTQDGKFYSNFPENYINYADYRYDCDLEAKKDNKVFKLMKEFTGSKEYWKNRSYFSMDAFYTEEQTKEMQEMFRQIKLKAKEYANENSKKKSIKGLFFRRMKFYDMMFSLLFAVFLTFGLTDSARAGGNDPTLMAKIVSYQEWISYLAQTYRAGGGNDPTAQTFSVPVTAQSAHAEPPGNSDGTSGIYAYNNDGAPGNSDGTSVIYAYNNDGAPGNSDGTSGVRVYMASYTDSEPMTDEDDSEAIFDNGMAEENGARNAGGGHDPTCQGPLGGGGHDPGDRGGRKLNCCIPASSGELVRVYSQQLCKAQILLFDFILCQQGGRSCAEIEMELYDILSKSSETK